MTKIIMTTKIDYTILTLDELRASLLENQAAARAGRTSLKKAIVVAAEINAETRRRLAEAVARLTAAGKGEDVQAILARSERLGLSLVPRG